MVRTAIPTCQGEKPPPDRAAEEDASETPCAARNSLPTKTRTSVIPYAPSDEALRKVHSDETANRGLSMRGALAMATSGIVITSDRPERAAAMRRDEPPDKRLP